jgi:hypothetical protein
MPQEATLEQLGESVQHAAREHGPESAELREAMSAWQEAQEKRRDAGEITDAGYLEASVALALASGLRVYAEGLCLDALQGASLAGVVIRDRPLSDRERMMLFCEKTLRELSGMPPSELGEE